MGINLGGLSYWSSELKFVDVARQSQEWITEHTEGPLSHQWDTHEHDNITWRDDGYPSFLPRKIYFINLSTTYMGNGCSHGCPCLLMIFYIVTNFPSGHMT